MDREAVIRMAREAGLAYGSDEKPLNSVTRFAALVATAEREKLATWMMRQGYATGHGDTTEDLLKELDWQIAERIRNECEECAKVCEDIDTEYEGEDVLATWCATAIRARGEK